MDEEIALQYAQKLEKEAEPKILAAIAEVYAAKPETANRRFFESNFVNVDGFDAISFFEQYSKVLRYAKPLETKDAVKLLNVLALDQGTSPWKRFSATKTMHELREFYRATTDEASVDDRLAMEEFGVPDLLLSSRQANDRGYTTP